MGKDVRLYSEIRINELSDFNKICDLTEQVTESQLSVYLFRGQRDESWMLESSLERYRKQIWENLIMSLSDNVEENSDKNDYSNRKPGDLKDKTIAKILEFVPLARIQQVIHNFNIEFPIPAPESYADWFSIVQHYGGKTRLLDFTSSFYTALYFALEQDETENQDEKEDSNKSFAVWVINPDMTSDQLFASQDQQNSTTEFNENFKKFKSFILSDKDDATEKPNHNLGISVLSPNHMSKRMLHQSGCFVYGNNMLASFEENLFHNQAYKDIQEDWKYEQNKKETELNKIRETQNGNIENKEIKKWWENKSELFSAKVTKIVIDRKLEKNIGLKLELANINSMQLFPDIEGLMDNFYRIKPYHFNNLE